MNLLTLTIASFAAGGTVFFLLDQGAGMADLAVKLDYELRIRQMRMRGLSLQIVIDFILKNPTGRELRISHPLVMLYYRQAGKEDNFLAQNTVFDRTYKLPAYGTLPITGLDFSVSVSDLVSVVSDGVSERAKHLFQQGKLLDLASELSKSIDHIRQHLIYKAFFRVNGVEIEYDANLEGLGYSPVSAIERRIKDGSEYDRYFARPEGKRKLVLKDGEVEDTVRQMHRIVEKDAHLIRDFSQLFKSNSRYETAQKLYDWVYTYLKYNLEKGEQLKNPLVSYDLAQRKAREFYRKHGYYNPEYSVDCDDIAIFIGSVLHNLDIPFAFRVAAYSPGRGYQHVYVITWDESGREIIIDPVFWRFDAEKPYLKEKTISRLDGIPVEYLYGTDEGVDTGKDFVRALRTAIATDYFGRLKGREYLLEMYDYLLRYWDSPHRQKAIEVLASKERELCRKGVIEKHNFFRLLSSRGLGDFWDIAMMSNPFTAPFALALYAYKSLTKRSSTKKPPSQTLYSSPTTGSKPYVQPASDSALSPPVSGGFMQKARLPLLIGGSVLALGTVGYLIFQTTKPRTNGKHK